MKPPTRWNVQTGKQKTRRLFLFEWIFCAFDRLVDAVGIYLCIDQGSAVLKYDSSNHQDLIGNIHCTLTQQINTTYYTSSVISPRLFRPSASYGHFIGSRLKIFVNCFYRLLKNVLILWLVHVGTIKKKILTFSHHATTKLSIFSVMTCEVKL